MYYHSQIPGLSEDFGDQIDYLVRGMVENFEEENPYLVSFIFLFNPLYTNWFFHQGPELQLLLKSKQT